MPKRLNAGIFERWAEKVAAPNDNGCWLWTGSLSGGGYGRIRIDMAGVVNMSAHRVSWMLNVGPIPDGLLVLHDCESFYGLGSITNRRCVFPGHLFLGTNRSNSRDAIAKGRFVFPTSPRGDSHYSRKNPGLLARGDNHGLRLHPESIPRGTRNGNASHSEEQVREAIALLADGATCAGVSRALGVGRQFVSRLKNGQSWSHLRRPWDQPEAAACDRCVDDVPTPGIVDALPTPEQTLARWQHVQAEGVCK